MFVEERDYKLEVLEYAINQCIDRLLPSRSEDALSIILYQSNELVWRVVTEIYTKSGHQIDFVFVRDILNLKIKPLRQKIAEEAELEAYVNEQARIRIEQEAEEARIIKRREEEKQQEFQKFKEEHPNIEINTYQEFDAFIEIFRIISFIVIDQLEVDERLITLEYIPVRRNLNWNYFSSSSNDSNEDNDRDFFEFVMAIQEEFDIEITDEEEERFDGCSIAWLTNFIIQKLD